MSTQLKNWFCNLGFWRWNHFYWPRDIPYLSKYRDYTVTLTKNSGETRDPIEKLVTIYKTPTISTTPYKLVQCDTQDTNPTDGLSLFNLELANDAICLGNEDYEVFYYHSTIDAEMI
jgi:hypothetical protein